MEWMDSVASGGQPFCHLSSEKPSCQVHPGLVLHEKVSHEREGKGVIVEARPLHAQNTVSVDNPGSRHTQYPVPIQVSQDDSQSAFSQLAPHIDKPSCP